MAEGVRMLLVGVVFPLWVGAGLADWACHRASAIERTSGLRENLVHWLLFMQMGLGVLAGLVLDTTAAVLVLLACIVLLHEVTVYLELRYTVARREVRPIEQVVHSLMEMLPLVALALLAALHWDQLRHPEWALRVRQLPLPAAGLALGGLAVAVFNALPLVEETLRCARWRSPSRTRPRPAPR
ncbi:MAG TPA: diguanylate cyclase [Ramlibacter sp.]|nr:diguanylate cyclase [Ramlibacter sp.]